VRKRPRPIRFLRQAAAAAILQPDLEHPAALATAGSNRLLDPATLDPQRHLTPAEHHVPRGLVRRCESVPTTSTACSAPVIEATKQPGPVLARIMSSWAAGYPCEHLAVASEFVLADGAIDEAVADCGGESLDIAVFPDSRAGYQ
jgi:hypothetical protein